MVFSAGPLPSAHRTAGRSTWTSGVTRTQPNLFCRAAGHTTGPITADHSQSGQKTTQNRQNGSPDRRKTPPRSPIMHVPGPSCRSGSFNPFLLTRACCLLPVACFPSPVTRHPSPVSRCPVPSAQCPVPVALRSLPVARCLSPVAPCAPGSLPMAAAGLPWRCSGPVTPARTA